MSTTGNGGPARPQSGQKRNKSKRAEIRAKRRKEEQRNRIIIICAIAVVSLVIAAILIIPNLPKDNLKAISLPENMNFPQENKNAIGDPDAPLKIEEFYDFNCSHCLDYALNLEDTIINNYVETGKVYIVSYSFAFLDATSYTAAQAAYCAMDQGKYWEYKQIAFYNASLGKADPYSNENLINYADKLGLDKKTFTTCLENKTYEKKLTEDMQYGEANGVTGTPSFLINGKTYGQADLEQAIIDALK